MVGRKSINDHGADKFIRVTAVLLSSLYIIITILETDPPTSPLMLARKLTIPDKGGFPVWIRNRFERRISSVRRRDFLIRATVNGH